MRFDGNKFVLKTIEEFVQESLTNTRTMPTLNSVIKKYYDKPPPLNFKYANLNEIEWSVSRIIGRDVRGRRDEKKCFYKLQWHAVNGRIFIE